MNDRPPQRQVSNPAGLCQTCAHMQVVPGARGAAFYLCRRSKTDARFPRYPAIPVIACAGFQPRDAAKG